MVRKQLAGVFAFTIACGLAAPALAQSPRVLNNFEDGSVEGWGIGFGAGISNIANYFNGGTQNHELRFDITGVGGAIRDGFNNTDAFFQNTAGGVDLTGLSTIEFDIRYEGNVAAQNLQFYVQATPSSTYVGVSDVTLTAGVPQTISFNLNVLTPAQIAYIRTWGVNVRALPAEQSSEVLTFYVSEVRSTGTPLGSRTYCDFKSDDPNNGFHGIFLNFNGAAIVGNTGQDQTGFSRVDHPGTDGVLQWQQQYAQSGEGIPFGPAWSWQNGFEAGFNGRPTDASNYNYIEVDISLENTSGTPLDVGYFTQTTTYLEDTNIVLNSFQYHNHDFKTLTANSGFQTLVFEIDKAEPLANMEHVMRHGLTFGAAAQDDLYTLRVDEIRAVTTIAPPAELSDGLAVY